DTAKLMLEGGSSGQALVPGQSDDSLLIRAIAGVGTKQMPPQPPRLTPLEHAMLRTWIDQGAKAPAGEIAQQPALAKTDPKWAFKKIKRPELPAVKDAGWCRNPIDHSTLARLEKAGIAPAPEADRITLVRRLSFDLIGLPPTITELDAALADQSPEWYDKVI